MFAEVLDYKDAIAAGDAADELLQQGNWIVAYVEPLMAWPVRVQKVVYRGDVFWIIPITKDACPAVATHGIGGNDAAARERISRFLSIVSWVDGHGVLVDSFGGGSRPFAYLKPSHKGSVVCDRLRLHYLPEVTNPNATLALALMREGRGLRHPAYSFLSFWRVLEVALGRKAIRSWVSSSLDRLTDRGACESLTRIKASGVADVADHLYHSGRCAIAHAGSSPVVDPDQPEDTRRLYQERPLVEALAVTAIEEKLGVKTSAAIFNEHLYELAGFKAIFGDDLVQRIIAVQDIDPNTVVDVPPIDFGLMDREALTSFQRLLPIDLRRAEGGLQFDFERADGWLRVSFTLNFSAERLEFDIHNGLYGPPDDGSPEYANTRADIHEFAKWYYMNGCLQILNSETGEQISRKDAFIPENVIVEPEGFDKEIERWRSEAQMRRAQTIG